MDSNDASDGGIPHLDGVTRPLAGIGTWRPGRPAWRQLLPAAILLAGVWGCGGSGSQTSRVSQEQLQATRTLRKAGATVRLDDQGRPIAVSLKNVELTDEALQALGQLESLQALDASRSGLTDEQLAQLENLTQLKSLNLARCSITSDGLKHLTRMTQLENLWLSRSKVRDAGLAHLSGLSQLKQLRISRTQITDKGLKHLESLSNLEMVQLRRTRVTDRGVAALKEALPEAQIQN